MLQIKAELLDNKRVSGNYFKMVIEAGTITKRVGPGQFISIRVDDGCETLLRRPFSVHRVIGKNITILYEVLGKGTEILSQKKSAEFLDVIGPLGNGFDYRRMKDERGVAILVAGGMGVAPLIFLAEKLAKVKTLALIGAKTKKQILCEKEFEEFACKVKISTDDGSAGLKGKVSDLLKDLLRATGYKPAVTIYACGPKPMLKEIALISKAYRIPAQISLEEHMACGIGACLGCVTNTIEGHKKVCKDGPVFLAEKIIWG